MVSIKRRLLSGSIWALAFKLSSAVLGFAVYALLARLLTINDLGTYFLIVSIVTFISIVVQMGLSTTALRLIAQSLAENNHVRACHVVRLTTLLVCFAGLLIGFIWLTGLNDLVSVNFFNSTAMDKLGWLTACWFFALAIQKHFAEVFRGFHDIRLASLFEGPASNLILCLTLLILFYFYDNEYIELSSVVFAVMSATLFASVVAIYLANRCFRLINSFGQVSSQLVWPIAWPILISNVAVFFVNHADLWILGFFVSKEEVALYGAAFRTVLLISLPMLIINSVIQPTIVELYTKGEKKKLENILGTTALVASIPAITILLIVIYRGDELLSIVFGGVFSEASLILTILCIGRTINVMTGSCGQCLMLGGHQKVMMHSTLLFGGLSIVLALLTVQQYGPVAVALSFATGMVLQNITQAILVRRYMGVSTFASVKWMISRFVQ